MDVSGQASVFLRYCDSNYVNACSATHLQTDKLRLSLLGAIRYGKPFVVDFQAADMTDTVLNALDTVQANLAEDLLSKAILKARAVLGIGRESKGGVAAVVAATCGERWTAVAGGLWARVPPCSLLP